MQLMKRIFLVLALAAGAAPATSSAAAADANIQGHVLGIPGDAISVDMDIFHELQPGDSGVLRRGGARIASVEVVRADQNTVFLRVLDSVKGFSPQADDVAYFTAGPPAKPSAGAGLGEEDLVPLLTPLPAAAPKKRKAPYKISARTHGRAMVRQFYQQVTPDGLYQRATRLDTDGSVDNVAGGPWSFIWSGNGSYQDGNRSSVSGGFRRFQPNARRLTLFRPLGDGGSFRAGRFFPKELPGLGTVDGLAIEAPVDGLRIGAVAGTRPDRRTQGFASHELLGSLYASAETGTPGQGAYAATLGVMSTRWLGRSDELAVLLDQNFDLGPLLSAYQTAQFDFNNGAAKFHKGTRLTRLDLSLNSNVSRLLILRGGLSHFEPVDVAAERAVAGGNSIAAIDNGYWRFWAGGGQTLPWDLGLDEDISWTRTEGRMQPGLWRATLWRQGLPWVPDGRAYFTGYNVSGARGMDYGGSAGAMLPVLQDKLILDANAGFHYDKVSSARRDLKLGDASVRLDWRPGRAWQLDATASKVWRGSADSSSLSAGLTFRR